jgi:ubiquinone/menaquinone biosynthesis C-methylase UbiE
MRPANLPWDAVAFPSKRSAATLRVLQNALPNTVDRALDIGCSSGGITLAMSDMLSDATVVGVDFDTQAMVGLNRRQKGHYLSADARMLPFRDGMFDLVTAFEIIEHIDDPKPMLAEIGRVLSPQGLLALSTPNRKSLTASTGRSLKRIFGLGDWHGWSADHKRLYDGDELISLLSSAGFQNVSMAGFWIMPEGFQLLPRIFGEVEPLRSLTNNVSPSPFWVRTGFTIIGLFGKTH